MHTTLLRRGSALLAGLALAAGVLGVATPARAASFSVSLTASDTTVVECEGVNLVGKVSPRPASHTIRVQQLMVGQTTWTTVATLSTTSAGNYRTTVRPDGPGDRYYRVYKPRSSTRKAGYSAKVLVHVTPQTGDVHACAASSPLAGGGTIEVTGSGLAATTAVTVTPQVPDGLRAGGFSAMPALAARFTVVDDTRVSVTMPANLAGTSVLSLTIGAGVLTTTVEYKRTWRSATSFEARILSEINKRRARTQTCRGDGTAKTMKAVPALHWNGGLSDLALAHSRDLAARQDVYDGLDHVTHGTTGFSARFQLAGVSGAFGEVLALSPKDYTASQVVSQWMSSTTGHCESVMSRTWTRAGVGVAGGVWDTGSSLQDSIFSNVDFER
ncbi:MAG: CAP domain-containing protein [Actinobacteria bacterium]|nr:CAP domain-containing protein [Actinomycetota bacterium]